MAKIVTDLKNLVNNYLNDHGPSKPSDIYNGIPAISAAYTLTGFYSTLHNMLFLTHEKGFVRLEGQALKPPEYPSFVKPLLLAAAQKGLTFDDVRIMAGSEAKKQLAYLKNRGLVRERRATGLRKIHVYEPTEKAREALG